MATILEHPIFSQGEIQNNIEGNPGRNPVEIIDVDAHDEHPASSSLLSQPPPRPRPALRPRHSFHSDAIISLVDDSDDEIEILSDPIPSSRQETSNRRRLRSPPPYSLMPTPPPPVPSIPRRYAGFTSLPAPPPFSAPPVRPNPQPFAFEQNLYPRDPSAAPSNRLQSPFLPPRRTTVPQGNTPQAAHLPSMGLGGALISSNNVRAQLAAAQAARAARTSHVIRRRPMSWFVTTTPNLPGLLFHDDPNNPPHIRRWLEEQRDHLVRAYQRFHAPEDLQAQVKYYQKYTHPEQPEPGFTFDFAPNSSDEDSSRERAFPPTSANAPIIIDDDDEHSSGGSSTSSKAPAAEPGKWTTILICAKCMTPLLLNDSLGPDDSGRRVWALRCGHMIDEQCLNDIGQPDEEAEPDSQTQQQQTAVDRKGKGKAKVKAKASYGEAVVEPIQSTNIRSRLRSAASSSSTLSNSLSNQQPPPPPPPTKRRRTAATVRKIEAEFEWKCPVPSCQLVHASVKIDGKWGPEKEVKQLATRTQARGAIPVFA